VEEWIEGYLGRLRDLLGAIPAGQVAEVIEELKKAVLHGRRIFAFGNGGSGTTSSHLVMDLGKGAADAVGRRFKVLSLNEAVGWMTALANDYSYEEVFVRQLRSYAGPGDVVLALSVSGRSENVVRAVRWASEHGLRTVALVGGAPAPLADLADNAIVVESEHCGLVEDAHLVICHLLCYAFMDNPDILEEE
jgi:D-sedoheptulose 7-phosphate isomerase